MATDVSEKSRIGYAWVMLAIALLVNATPIILENRTEPLLPFLMDTFRIEFEQAGYMKSVGGLTGLLMLMPAGLFIQRVGNKRAGIAALVLLAAGEVLGAVATSYSILLVGLFLEGISGAVLAVLAVNLVIAWFPPERRGVPMGFITGSLNIGIMIGVMGAPILLNLSFIKDWRAVWWLEAGFAAVVLLLFWTLHRSNSSETIGEKQNPPTAAADARKVLTNPALLLMGLTVFIFTFSYTASNFFPAFLITTKGFTPSQAGGMIGIASFTGLVGGPVAGFASDRLKTRRWVILVGILLSLPFLFTVMRVPESYYPLYMIWAGFAASLVLTPLLSGIPEVLEDPSQASLAIAFFWVFNFLAVLVANPVLGGILDASGWVTALNVSGVIGLFGLLIILLNRKLR